MNRSTASLLCALALILASCQPRQGSVPKPLAQRDKGQTSGASGEVPEAKGPDPRAAFESSGLLGGLSARLESSVPLLPASGSPEAGPCLALGANLSEAAVARRSHSAQSKGYGHELVLASGASASLPGPALAIASAGERFVVASSLGQGGALIGFKAEGEGERLIESWKKEGAAVRRLLSVPGGRAAAAEDDGPSPRVFLLDAATGAELWAQSLPLAASDIAYAPGMILAASGSQLGAYDESTGSQLWIASLPAVARSLAAGNGVALVLAQSGSLSAFSLADGKGLGAAPGPFDPRLRPIADGGLAIAALPGGGAEELEVKSGKSLRRWSWPGPASFIAADRDRLYAGIADGEGGALYLGSRAGENGEGRVSLAGMAFDAPVAVSGSRGGLLMLLEDGSLVLAGKSIDASPATTLDAAASPPPEAVAAIASALGRFKTAEAISSGDWLRFDAFSQGVPVDAAVAFTAFRYECAATGKRLFSAKPAASGEVVAIYDETGRELAASIDELGSVSRAEAYLEKGKLYWVVAGWIQQAESSSYRLFVK